MAYGSGFRGKRTSSGNSEDVKKATRFGIGSTQKKSSCKKSMKHASELAVGFWTPRPPSLDGVLSRLESLSRKPEFRLQRELAEARALKPYLEGSAGRLVTPLEQEIELANLYLFCDYYPDDGQLTLIEQLRDIITEHISEEERQWLDPLKHSFLDVLKPISSPR